MIISLPIHDDILDNIKLGTTVFTYEDEFFCVYEGDTYSLTLEQAIDAWEKISLNDDTHMEDGTAPIAIGTGTYLESLAQHDLPDDWSTLNKAYS